MGKSDKVINMSKVENTIIFFKFLFRWGFIETCLLQDLLFSACFARAPRSFTYTAHAVCAKKIAKVRFI